MGKGHSAGMKGFVTPAVVGLAMLFAWPVSSFAEDVSADDLKAVQDEIAGSATRQDELEATAKAAVEEQNELSDKLVALADTAAAQERALTLVENRQQKLKDSIARINIDLAQRQDAMAEVLAGLQSLSQNPPPALVVAPDDVLGALRGAMVFSTVVPQMRSIADELRTKLADLATMRAQLDAEAKEHDQALTALTASRTEINALIAEKKALALQSRQDLDAERKHAEELAAKATSLQQLLDQLAAEKQAAEAKASAQAEAERKAQEASLLPQVVFSKAQGLLKYPAQGDIIRQFGEASGLGSNLDGLLIATAMQAQVTSPVTGKVEFAGKFRSYGQMVIINPGENYLVLLAGLDQVNTAHGQTVRAGEPVGSMGTKAGSVALSNGLTDLTRPVLYVEFRRNGNPVDPNPWWIGKRQEAMR